MDGTVHHPRPLATPLAKRRWFMYRTRQGDLYFFDAVKNLTQWERPSGLQLKHAVNDRESWRAYRDNDGHVYYRNLQTEETTYSSAPECTGLTPVNDADSWVAVEAPEDSATVYYHNYETKETTWCKPPYLDEIQRVQAPKVEGSVADYHAADGAGFVIPEGDSSEDEDDGSGSSEEEERGSGKVRAGAEELKRRQEEILAQARADRERMEEEAVAAAKAIERERVAQVEAGFLEMLGEQQDLRAFSQWTKWLPKLSGDKRFMAVPVEDRVRLFNRYVHGLGDAGVGSGKERVKQARKAAVELRDTGFGRVVAAQLAKPKTKEVIQAIDGFDKPGAEEVTLRRRLLELLRGLDDKAKKKALKPFIRKS